MPNDATADANADPDAGDTSPPIAACAGLPADVTGVSLTGEGRWRRLEGVPLLPELHPRTITVWLPASYDSAPERRYPVLYMHDGRNLFDRATATYGVEWGVDEVVDQLVGQGEIAELIVVGVDHSDERIPDYTPSADPEYGGGKGPLYVRWLAAVLKPAVDTLLRTRCASSATGLAGSSLGGLISFWAGLTYPEVFGRIGAVSPSFWWDDRAQPNAFASYTGSLPERLWVDMGTGEDDFDPAKDGDVPPSVQDVREVRDRALALGAVMGTSLGYLEAFGWQHNESAWRQRLPAILRFLFGEVPLPAADALTLRVLNANLRSTGPGHSTTALVETRHGARGRLTWPNREAIFTVTTGDSVTIDADGRVEAVGLGESTVSVALFGLTAEVTVAVSDPR